MKKLSQKVSSALSLLVKAIKGEEYEYTSGSINRAIFLLAVPMILEMVMESLFALVDIYFVSKVSTDAAAAVGLTESVLFIIYSIAMGLSMAVTAMVSRRVGEKNYKRASDAAFQAVMLGIAIAVPLGLAGYFFAGDILTLMGAEASTLQEGVGYTRIMYGGNINIILLFMINAIFRGAGNATIAMRVLVISNSINMFLDPALIFGWGPFPEMGVEGAAVATNIGRSIGVCYQVYFLLKGTGIIKIAMENVVIRMETVKEMIRVASAGMGQFLVESASWMFLVKIMAEFEAEALAAYTFVFRLLAFTILPAFGLANAAATLVGQNLGANEPLRAETSVWRASAYTAVYLFLISIVFYAFAESILGFFTVEPVVLDIGISGLKIVCLGYVFFSYGMVVGQAFNGAGDTQTPLIISFVVFWAIQIPLAYLFAIVFDWKSDGVFATIAIAHSLYAVIAVVLFRRGKWKETKV